MAQRAELKFRGDMPFHLEHILCAKYGFAVKKRQGKEYFIVEKVKHSWKPEVLVNGELPEDIQDALVKRCVTVCHQFREPEIYIKTIKIRLSNIAKTLPPLQREFIFNWMDQNLKEDK